VETVPLGTVALLVAASVALVMLGVMLGLLWHRRTDARPAGHGSGSEDPNDELIAVLAAAAALMLKRKVRVRRVRFLTPSVEPAWTVTGRLNIMASHAISRRKPHL
jgi:hypothetical protein